MPVHRIHLKGPWEFEWLSTPGFSRKNALQGASCFLDDARLRMPADWRAAFGNRGGAVRFRRRFQWPTNLDPGERAFLVFDGVGGTGGASLNGDLLGPLAGGPASFEITGRLRSTNLLTVTLVFDPAAAEESPGGLWAPVAIAIHEVGTEAEE